LEVLQALGGVRGSSWRWRGDAAERPLEAWHGVSGPDPIWWIVGLCGVCRSFFVLLFFFQEQWSMWTLWKTAVFAVFQVPCGRVLCVHRDDSVHIVFNRATDRSVDVSDTPRHDRADASRSSVYRRAIEQDGVVAKPPHSTRSRSSDL